MSSPTRRPEILAAELKRARTRRGESLKAAAEQLGTTATTVQRWEAGAIPAKAVHQVAVYAGVDPEDALDMVLAPGADPQDTRTFKDVLDEVAALRSEVEELRALVGPLLEQDRLADDNSNTEMMRLLVEIREGVLGQNRRPTTTTSS